MKPGNGLRRYNPATNGTRREVYSERTMNEPQSRGRILRGTKGIGTVSPEMIEQRAREIARGDGRAQPNESDRASAREDLVGATSTSEKPATRKEPGRDWGNAAGVLGRESSHGGS
jgi:hypothetical protein